MHVGLLQLCSSDSEHFAFVATFPIVLQMPTVLVHYTYLTKTYVILRLTLCIEKGLSPQIPQVMSQRTSILKNLKKIELKPVDAEEIFHLTGNISSLSGVHVARADSSELDGDNESTGSVTNLSLFSKIYLLWDPKNFLVVTFCWKFILVYMLYYKVEKFRRGKSMEQKM